MRKSFLSLVFGLICLGTLNAQDTVLINQDLSIDFEYLPGGCSEDGSFSTEDYQNYTYNESISMDDLNQLMDLIVGESIDSVVISERYQNVFGWEISETEGVVFCDDKRFDFPKEELIYTRDWSMLETTEGGKYAFTSLNQGQIEWQPHMPAIHHLKLIESVKGNAWFAELANDKALQTYLYKVALKILLYSEGRYKKVILHFPVRHGEC